MSAVVKRIPRDQRLRVTARFEHEVICYHGDIFQFIEKLMSEKYTGFAHVKFNSGGVMAMEFDFRQEVPIARDDESQKRLLDMARR